MSDLWFMFRNVYGKQHELPDGSTRHGPSGNGTIRPCIPERIRLAKHAGIQVMELLKKDIRPRDIMTEEAVINALTVDMALGCSTNSMRICLRSHMRSEWTLKFRMRMRSAQRPRICATWHRQDRLIWKISMRPAVSMRVMNELNKKDC